MSSKVSVILPVYNSERYLNKCIESILNQTYSNIELIIVNDGSTDNSDLIINNYKKQNPKILYYMQKNKGPSEARNKGILNSTGEYLVFVDSDDTIDRRYIEILVNNIITLKSDIVCCGYKEVSKHGILNYSDFNFDYKVSQHSFIEMVCKGTGGVLWSKIFKKEIIELNNLKMDKELFMCEDLVFVLHYASFCKSFSAVNQYLYNYNRLNKCSLSSTIKEDYIQNLIRVNRSVESILKKTKMKEKKIEEIIQKRKKGNIIELLDYQVVNIKKNGFKKTINKVNHILSYDLINNSHFTKNIIFKPYFFFIKKKYIIPIIIYGLYLNYLRKLKYKIKKRTKVIW